MAHADDSQNRLKRMIVAVLTFFGRMLGLHRPTIETAPASDSKQPSEEAQRAAVAAEKRIRFRRALLMLDLAVAHARHGFPDSARGLLNAAWSDLESNPTARIEWRATAALVFALGNSTRQATDYLHQAINEYENAYHSLSPAIRERIYRICATTMEQLPHNRHVEQLVNNAQIAHQQGDFVTALRLLDQTDMLYTQYSRLISPDTNSRRLNTWYAILEDMKNRGGSSTGIILDAFRGSAQYAPA